MKWIGAMLWIGAAIASLAAGVVIPIPVNAPTAGFVSLALVDTNGVLVRTLAYAEPMTGGERTFFWDGTDDLGLPVAPGNYATRGIFFKNPPGLKYVMKVGTSGNPPWRTRDDRGDWGGDLGGPSALVANSNSLMVAWSAVENYNLPGIQQIDTNGNVFRIYTSFYPYDGRMAGAMDDQNFYLGILNRDEQRIEIAEFELGTDSKRILTNLPTPPHYTLSGRWKGRWQSMLDGMAVTPTRIFSSLALDDALFILDRNTGSILEQVSLPSPRGLTVLGDRLLVVSSNRVLRLTFDGEVETNLIESPLLLDPYLVAVDRSGNIYVSDSGSRRTDPDADAGNHQVFVFSSDGAHLWTIGSPGGSPRSGHIVREAFGDIRGVCIGPDDKLWVNEEITGFKRTSRWNTNGTLEREWFQRKLTHYTDLLNPARPSELIYPANGFDDHPALTAYHINWTNGTWEPAWSYAQTNEEMYQENVYLSNDHDHSLQQYQPGKRHPVFHYHPAELVTFNGRNYFLNHDGNGDGAIFTYTETNKPQPVALVGYHRVDIITNRVVSYYDTGPNRWFTWADLNGNGRMALGECLFASPARLALSGRIWDAKLETNMSIRMLRPIGSNVLLESVLPMKQMLSNGVPVYDWSLLQDLSLRRMPTFNGGDGWKRVTRVNDETMPMEIDGAVYSLIDPRTDIDLELPSLDHFWADRNWRKRIAKFDRATGKFLWASGRRAPGRVLNGEMYNPFGLSFSHGTLFVSDVLGMVWTWSRDGLFLGRLLNDAEPGRTWDEYAVHVEVLGPVTLFTNTVAGKLHMIVNDTGAHVYEVTLPNLEPLPTNTITVTAETLTGVRSWDPDSPIPIAGSILQTEVIANTLRLSWHTNAAALTLQSAANLTGPWTIVSAPRQTNNETVSVSVSPAVGRRFFRLAR